MSYFGQRLKIYFSCEREQLSNRLIMILETQASPVPQGRPAGVLSSTNGSPRVPESGGWGTPVQRPPDPLPSCQGGRNPRATAGRGEAAVLSRRG